MKNKIILLSGIILLINIPIIAQDIPEFKPTPYRDADNKLYWNMNQEVFISLSTSKNGKQENLESKISSKYVNPFYFDTEGLNYIRSNWAVDKTTKKTASTM